nr:MAG TPA_asm: hypothetical protein [Caudoviricetes sp.]
MTHDEMIAVIKHHRDGGKVEIRPRHSTGRWCDVSAPSWSFADSEYRPKKEPVVMWGVVWQDGTVSTVHFKTREGAEFYAKGRSPGRVVKMVEVEE